MAQYSVRRIQLHISEILRQLKDGEQPIITNNSEPIAAIISISDFERFQEMKRLDPRTITLQVTPHADPASIADAVLTAYDQDPLAAMHALQKDIENRNAAMGIIIKRLAMEAE